MQARSYTPEPGDRVIAGDGERGTIGAVDEHTAYIRWDSAITLIRYPRPLGQNIRKALPWE